MDPSKGIKQQLVSHLEGGEAFMPIEEMLEKITFSQIGKRPAGLPYSFYELFCHIRFTQKDILEYCTQKDYLAPNWPDAYWPKEQAPENEPEWDKVKKSYFQEREELVKLILSPENELMEPVPSGKHNLFREILLVIEHTSYHSGQLLILLRHLGLHTT